MLEFIYSDRIYITGSIKTVQEQLAQYAQQYNTVLELLNAKAPAAK